MLLKGDKIHVNLAHTTNSNLHINGGTQLSYCGYATFTSSVEAFSGFSSPVVREEENHEISRLYEEVVNGN